MRHRFLLFTALTLLLVGTAVAHGLVTGQIHIGRFQHDHDFNQRYKAAELATGYKQAGDAGKPFGDAKSIGQQLSNGNCVGSGAGLLSRSAMDPDDFNMIIPYGLMTGGHVTPIDHQYYSPASYDSPRDAYSVYAMGDAQLVEIEHRTEQPQDNDYVRTHKTDEYRLVFSQTCTFFYYYDLLTSLTPELTDAFYQASHGRRTASVNIHVSAGQLIGAIGGQTLDFAVWDTTKPLHGFMVPEHYNREPWKLYTADPLEYYTPELKQFMLSRYPRLDEPLSGKLDWDLDGTLRGTWFLEGTDYSGDVHDQSHSWKTHLAFAPDLYDPSHFVISLGDYRGDAGQFNAKGNKPDPSNVSMPTGLVKYELVKDYYSDSDGMVWDQRSFLKGPKIIDSYEVFGTLLVRLIGPRTLKVEIFPDTSADQVKDFTSHAKIYTR